MPFSIARKILGERVWGGVVSVFLFPLFQLTLMLVRAFLRKHVHAVKPSPPRSRQQSTTSLVDAAALRRDEQNVFSGDALDVLDSEEGDGRVTAWPALIDNLMYTVVGNLRPSDCIDAHSDTGAEIFSTFDGTVLDVLLVDPVDVPAALDAVRNAAARQRVASSSPLSSSSSSLNPNMSRAANISIKLQITVLLTHHHWDHAGGLPELRGRYLFASVLRRWFGRVMANKMFPCDHVIGRRTPKNFVEDESAPKGDSKRSTLEDLSAQLQLTVCGSVLDASRVPPFGSLDVKLHDGEQVPLSADANFRVTALATPCHTKGSMCYFIEFLDRRRPPAVFTGDTLFASGAGKFFEGDGAEFCASVQALFALPDETEMFSGHEYAGANLKFALAIWRSAIEALQKDSQTSMDRDAMISNAQELLASLRARLDESDDALRRNQETSPSTLREEREYNLFVRLVLGDPLVTLGIGFLYDQAQKHTPPLQRNTDRNVALVTYLRQQKDSWKKD